MRAHGVARGIRIVLFDRAQDFFVMKLSPFQSAFRARNPLALLSQEVHDRIDEHGKDGILSRFCQREVKIEIEFNKEVGVVQGTVHCCDGGARLVELFFLCALGCKRGDFWFEHFAHFDQAMRAIVRSDLDHQIERMTSGLGCTVRDECAAAMLDRNQTFLSEGLDGFTDRSAAHAELLSEVAFRGKLIAEFEIGVEDLGFDLLHDAFVEPFGVESLVRHCIKHKV